nr:MAG TPA: hypothetical protein [Caudoviricetes sp.]
MRRWLRKSRRRSPPSLRRNDLLELFSLRFLSIRNLQTVHLAVSLRQ